MRIAPFALVVAALLAACAPGSATAEPPPLGWETSVLTVETPTGAHRFDIEIADDIDEQQRGLMYRTAMAPDAGMLFVYPDQKIITMWMKNTVLPLDMIFIGADGRIVSVLEGAVPYSEAILSSGVPALAVLEVNAGIIKAIGVQPGSRVRHAAFGTAP